MPVLAQICVVFAVCLVSEGLAALLPFSFPATVLSMVLLLVLLGLRILKPHQLKQESDFLMDHMAIFFVPACVGVLRYTEVLFQNFWAIVLISLLTTPLVFFVTGHAVQLTMRLLRRKENKHNA